MPTTLEERVAYLEGKVEEHSSAWQDLKDMIINLGQKVDRRIDALDQKIDRKTDALDQRINRLDVRIDSLDQKFSRYFLWIIGIQVTTLLTIIATLLKS